MVILLISTKEAILSLVFVLTTGIFLINSLSVFVYAQESTGQNSSQIVIGNTGSIDKFSSYGEYTDPEYKAYYSPTKVFDNIINTVSYWGQKGDSGFQITLDKPLKSDICSFEINSETKDGFPTNSKYNLLLGNKNITGKLTSKVLTVPQSVIGECIKDVDEIKFDIKPVSTLTQPDPHKVWNAISEIKLFSDQAVQPPPIVCDEGFHMENGQCVPDTPTPPPVEPPVEPPVINGSSPSIIISGSDVKLDVKNSTVTLDTDEVIIKLEGSDEITNNITGASGIENNVMDNPKGELVIN